MNSAASKTKNLIYSYPMHRHKEWEVMYYLSGTGFMKTEKGDIPFSPGTIIVMPPKILHGSTAQDGFLNIPVRGDFDLLFFLDEPACFEDNANKEGEMLIKLIACNRYSDSRYLKSLYNAYVDFLLLNIKHESGIKRTVSKITDTLTKNYTDPGLNTEALLENSGYTADYIRSKFKQITELTPIAMLTKIRIDNACRIIEWSGDDLSMQEVALKCGFDDPVYFSRRFKQIMGVSPTEYKKQVSS